MRSLLRALGVRRSTLAAARLYAERSLLSVRGDARARPTGRILCYHSVGTPAWGVNDVSPARFRRQLESALRRGYRFVPAREIALTGGTAVPPGAKVAAAGETPAATGLAAMRRKADLASLKMVSAPYCQLTCSEVFWIMTMP